MKINQSHYDSDPQQTAFIDQQLLLSRQSPAAIEPTKKKTKKRNKRLPLIIGAVIWAILIFIFIAAAIYYRRRPQTAATQPSPTPTTETIGDNNDELFQRLQEISQDLDSANPQNQDLGFPPVQMEIDFQKSLKME